MSEEKKIIEGYISIYVKVETSEDKNIFDYGDKVASHLPNLLPSFPNFEVIEAHGYAVGNNPVNIPSSEEKKFNWNKTR